MQTGLLDQASDLGYYANRADPVKKQQMWHLITVYMSAYSYFYTEYTRTPKAGIDSTEVDGWMFELFIDAQPQKGI